MLPCIYWLLSLRSPQVSVHSPFIQFIWILYQTIFFHPTSFFTPRICTSHGNDTDAFWSVVGVSNCDTIKRHAGHFQHESNYQNVWRCLIQTHFRRVRINRLTLTSTSDCAPLYSSPLQSPDSVETLCFLVYALHYTLLYFVATILPLAFRYIDACW